MKTIRTISLSLVLLALFVATGAVLAAPETTAPSLDSVLPTAPLFEVLEPSCDATDSVAPIWGNHCSTPSCTSDAKCQSCWPGTFCLGGYCAA